MDMIAGAEPYLAFGLLILIFAAFLTERYPPDVTAAGGAALFIVLGLVPYDDVMSVFSNPAPITIGAMFILSGAMVRTGLMDALADAVISRAETQPAAAVAIFLVTTIMASAFVNNTPVVLVLIPVVTRLAASLKLAPTQLLIPLSYAAILGGTCSLIGTSTNLLVDGISREAGMEPFSIFEISGVGLVAAASGVALMLILGPRLLPRRTDRAGETVGDAELVYLSEATVQPGFDGIGRPLSQVGAFSRAGVTPIGLRRRGETIRTGLGDLLLEPRDTVIVKATTSELLTLNQTEGLSTGIRRGTEAEDDAIMAEAVLTPRSTVARPRVSDLSIGPRGGIRIVGVHRHRHIAGPDLTSARLRMGDRLLVRASPSNLDRMADAGDLLAITRPTGRAYRRTKAPIALAALAAVVGLAALEVAPIGILALISVAAMLVLRCIDNDEAWGSVDGGILILIFSMLIIGAGLEATGAVEVLVDALTPWLDGLPPILLLLTIYFTASVLTELVTNNAVAVVLTPLVISMAESLGLDPRGLVVAVMFAASASFATPIGYQTNTLVYRAAAYTFADFLKIGIPMNLVVGLFTCFAITWLFPF